MENADKKKKLTHCEYLKRKKSVIEKGAMWLMIEIYRFFVFQFAIERMLMRHINSLNRLLYAKWIKACMNQWMEYTYIYTCFCECLQMNDNAWLTQILICLSPLKICRFCEWEWIADEKKKTASEMHTYKWSFEIYRNIYSSQSLLSGKLARMCHAIFIILLAALKNASNFLAQPHILKMSMTVRLVKIYDLTLLTMYIWNASRNGMHFFFLFSCESNVPASSNII